jgi:heterodisulfide reductase subunit C
MSLDSPSKKVTEDGSLAFLYEVEDATPGDARLNMCIQCGTCGGSCPSGFDMDATPRKLFAMIRAGMREEVLKSNVQWYCVSCYYCTTRCPQEVHITDIMYTLKNMSIKSGYFQETGAGLARTFTDYVENYGRSFEFGLATRYNLRYRPLTAVGMGGLGWGMFSKGRMEFRPKKIKGLDQLKAILDKAKELEAEAAK